MLAVLSYYNHIKPGCLIILAYSVNLFRFPNFLLVCHLATTYNIWIGHVDEYPTMHYLEFPDTLSQWQHIIFWLRIFGSASGNVHCVNVVSMPYWTNLSTIEWILFCRFYKDNLLFFFWNKDHIIGSDLADSEVGMHLQLSKVQR